MRMVWPLAAVQLPAQIIPLRVHNDRLNVSIAKAIRLVMAEVIARLRE